MANEVPTSRVTSNLAWEVRQRPLNLAGGLATAAEGIAVDARRIYVTSYSYNPQQPAVGQGARLIVLDADTLERLAERSVSGTPRAIAVSPNRNRIYVAGVGQNGTRIAQFDASTFASLGVLQLNGPPRRVVHSVARSRLYVTIASLGTLLVLDDASGAAIATVNVGQGATGVALDGDRIFVTLSNPSSVPEQNALVVVDAGTHAILQKVPIAPVASSPQDVAVLPAIKRVFVANVGGVSQSPRLTVLSRENLAPLGEIPLPGAAVNLAVDVERNRVYAATQAGLVVVDGAQNRTLTVLGPGRAARGASFSQRTGQLVWGDPVDGVASSAVQPGESPFDFQLLRPDDLLSLDFTFHNLKLVTDGSPRLVRAVEGQPAFVAVHFPSQSVAEETAKTGANVRPPTAAVLAGRSRLVFRLPAAVRELAFTTEGLLDWSALEPSLAPVALAPGTAPRTPRPAPSEPLPTHTAIELPYRLALSPDATAGWEHAPRPVAHSGRVELWQTRLGRPDGAAPSVRAIWTPDLVKGPQHSHELPLDGPARTAIVRETSDWTLLDGAPSYTPVPAEADELMLSALGGFLRLRGVWNPPPGLNVTLWRQTTTLGRDHKVTAVSRGILFPWGHRAVKVELTEREITTSPDGPVAALRKRTIIVVSETEKSYVGQPFNHGGREMPFAGGVRLLTTVTPELDTTDKVAEAKAEPNAEPEPAFWICTPDGPFEFDVSAQDPAGRRATFQAQLIWVPETVLRNATALDQVGAAYQKDDRRSVPISGQSIAFAATTGAGAIGSAAAATSPAKDIGLTTERLVFGVQRRVQPGGAPAFLPRLERAAVRIPAVEQMLGVTDAVDIELYQEYLDHGLQSSRNAAAVFAKPIAQLPRLAVPAGKAGGLAAAAFEVSGISERLGPVAGDLSELAQGSFGAKSLAALAGSKLLGTISLDELIAQVTDGAAFDQQLPALATEVERDAANVPTAVTNRLRWTPRIHDFDPFKASLGGKDATLTIDTLSRQQVAGGEPDYEITGELTNFHIEFLSVLDVNFRELTFKSVKGQKANLHPVLDSLEPVTFRGPLAFLDKLREQIPYDGFSDPPALDVSERGIDVSYSVGLPPLSSGAFSLQNVTLGAGLFLPFIDEAANLRFNFSERHNPFGLIVMFLSGGGFFALEVELDRIVLIEAALEFGAAAAVNLGVARGSLYVMGGVYFALRPGLEEKSAEVELTAYLRAGGELRVLGLISISTEFYMALTYLSATNELRGQATVRARVRVAFLHKTVKITLERRFAGPPRRDAARLARSAELAAAPDDAPTFGDAMTQADWQAYAGAFA